MLLRNLLSLLFPLFLPYAVSSPVNCFINCKTAAADMNPRCLPSSSERYSQVFDGYVTCPNLCHVGSLRERQHLIRVFLECLESTELAVTLVDSPRFKRTNPLLFNLDPYSIKKVDYFNDVIRLLLVEHVQLVVGFVDLGSPLLKTHAWLLGTSIADVHFNDTDNVTVIRVLDNKVMKSAISVNSPHSSWKLLYEPNYVVKSLEIHGAQVHLYYENDEVETFSVWDDDYAAAEQAKARQTAAVRVVPVVVSPKNWQKGHLDHTKDDSAESWIHWNGYLEVLLVLIFVTLIAILVVFWKWYRVARETSLELRSNIEAVGSSVQNGKRHDHKEQQIPLHGRHDDKVEESVVAIPELPQRRAKEIKNVVRSLNSDKSSDMLGTTDFADGMKTVKFQPEAGSKKPSRAETKKETEDDPNKIFLT